VDGSSLAASQKFTPMHRVMHEGGKDRTDLQQASRFATVGAIPFVIHPHQSSKNKFTFIYVTCLQEALQMPRDCAIRHRCEILHLKRLAIGNDLQGHSRSLQLLLLDRPYTTITSC